MSIEKTVAKNQHFLELSGLTSEWIEQRTGIHTRSKAKEGENINMPDLRFVTFTIHTTVVFVRLRLLKVRISV